MDKRRLLKLADLLESDADNPSGVRFDLETWASTEGPVPTINCGTQACAIGLAMLSPEFNLEGLHFGDGYLTQFSPHFEGERGFDAVETFFGLSDKEANFLFVYAHYDKNLRAGRDSELAVAKRIRDFVAGNAAPSRS